MEGLAPVARAQFDIRVRLLPKLPARPFRNDGSPESRRRLMAEQLPEAADGQTLLPDGFCDLNLRDVHCAAP